MTRKISLLCVGAVLATLLAGCNTMAGFGQDLKVGGQAIQNAADKNK